MLQNLKRYFDRHIRPAGTEQGAAAAHALHVATAALLFEVMRMDGEIKDIERHAVMAAMQRQFGLAAEEIATLMRLAEAEAKQATDYYQFTTLIDRHFTAEQKEHVVEQLWRVACADSEIDRFERTLVQKTADLLHVPRTAQIAARERALNNVRQADLLEKDGRE
jgi:uncharacterized tellurite resistance protein B-like protein